MGGVRYLGQSPKKILLFLEASLSEKNAYFRAGYLPQNQANFGRRYQATPGCTLYSNAPFVDVLYSYSCCSYMHQIIVLHTVDAEAQNHCPKLMMAQEIRRFNIFHEKHQSDFSRLSNNLSLVIFRRPGSSTPTLIPLVLLDK